MATIRKNFKTASGKNAEVELMIENHRVNGTASINGTSYSVSDYAVVQGKKVINLVNAPAPYLQIPDSLYAELDKICKAQFAARMTPRQILEGKVAEAQATYQKLFNAGNNNVAIINARNEWQRLSDELAKSR